MKWTHFIVMLGFLTIFLLSVFTHAYPLNAFDDHNGEKSVYSSTPSFQILSEIPVNKVEESISNSRQKRSIGILRQYFPGISELVDRIYHWLSLVTYQLLTRYVLWQERERPSSSE